MNTKDHIAKIYIQLVSSGSFDLSVKEITEASNVSRQTFYYYYKDLTDLIEYILENILSELISKAIEKNNIKDGLMTFLYYTKVFKSEFLKVLNKEKLHKLEYCIDDSLRHYLKYIYPNLSSLKLKYISHGLALLLIDYADDTSFYDEIIDIALNSLDTK